MSDIITILKSFTTPTLSDALDSLNINGGLENIYPQTTNCNICGQAFTVKYGIPNLAEQQIGKAADFIDDVPSHKIIVLANNGRLDCTVWGGILTQLALLKNINGTVIDGMCRDIDEIQLLNYPIFTKGIYMKSGKGRTKKIATQVPVFIGNTSINPDDYIRGDKNGIIVIPKQKILQVLDRAAHIKKTEHSIVTAIKKGIPLKAARNIYKYHRPWQDNIKNE